MAAVVEDPTHLSQKRENTKDRVSFWPNSIFRQAMEDESVKRHKSHRGAALILSPWPSAEIVVLQSRG